jgi:hypothetical protein
VLDLRFEDVERITRDGAPMVLQALGRVYGLGPRERRALGATNGSGLPAWTWALLGIAAGFVAGARVQKAWPDKLPVIVRGGK